MAAAEPNSTTKTLTARCHCNAANFSVTLPTASLPLKTRFCHCSVCRYITGSLATFHATLPEGVSPDFVSPSALADLTSYAFDGNKRLHCSTCGAHVGAIHGATGRWVVATSLFDAEFQVDDVLELEVNTFTESAPGGGLYSFVKGLGMKTWNPETQDLEGAGADPKTSIVRPERETMIKEGKEVERLRVQCHCGGVSFTVGRPDDMEPGLKTDPYIAKFVSPLDKNKWVACLDACDDCRLVTGTHVIAWTFVPRLVIDPPISTLLPSEPESIPRSSAVPAAFSTLKRYSSSKGTERYFCSRCSATVFFVAEERRPTQDTEVVDIALGLVRAPEGVLAEEWVTWRGGRVGWLESGVRFDKRFAEALAAGHREWSVEKFETAPEFLIG